MCDLGNTWCVGLRVDQVGPARLNFKEVRDTDTAPQFHPEREDCEHIGVKRFAPRDGQPVGRQKNR